MSFFSLREEVGNHCVKWGMFVSFPCKMTASISTGVLDTCNYRVSIRKVGLLHNQIRDIYRVTILCLLSFSHGSSFLFSRSCL